MRMGAMWNIDFLYKSVYLFQFLATKLFSNTCSTSIPPVRGEELENITFLNRPRHIMQFLTIFMVNWHLCKQSLLNQGYQLDLKNILMAPPRKHLHANFKMSPVDPRPTGQLRNLPSRHIAIPSQWVQQSAHDRRCHNSAPGSLVPDLDDSWDDGQPLAVYRNQKPGNSWMNTFQCLFRTIRAMIYNSTFQDHFGTY